MANNIFDDYLQQMQFGWSPPPGAEGQAAPPVVTSGNAAWQAAQSGRGGQPMPQPTPQGGVNPARDLMNWSNQQSRNSFFPAANYSQPYGSGAGNAGYGPGQGSVPPAQNPAYQTAVSQGGGYQNRYDSSKGGLTMVNSPNGGSIGVPQNQLQKYISKGYTLGQPPTAKEQAFNVAQGYQTGYGQPSPAIQQSTSGAYQISGGVAAPYGANNPFESFFSGVSNLARGSGTAIAKIGNSLFGGKQNQPSQQSQNFYAYNPSPVPTQPRRYFDF